MTALTAEETLQRARRAESIITDPLVAEAFQAIEATLLKQWRDPDGTPEDRERVWLALQNVDVFRGMFERYIRSGKVAAREIEDAQRKKVSNTEP